MIVSETMNAGLGKEAQVSIMRNLYAQAPSATRLPSAVTVHVGLERRQPEEPCVDLGRIFTLDADVLRAWQGEGDSLPAASIRLPLRLPGKPTLAGGSVLDFHYRLGAKPGLAFRQSETPTERR